MAWRARDDHPDLVLLHGFTDDGGCWDPWLSRFGRPGLTVDARGHGASDLPAGPISAPVQADGAAAVIEEVADHPVVLIGHSMGAATAAALTVRRPDLVRAAVLEDPRGAAVAATDRRPAADWVEQVRGMSTQAAVDHCRASNPSWPDDELLPWVQSKQRLDLAVFDRPRSASTDLSDTLSAATCPLLLIHGNPDRGGIISAAEASACVRANDGVHAVPVDVGHNVRREAPGHYLDAVRSFLAELD